MNLILKIVSSSFLLFLCFLIAQQSDCNDGTLLNYSFSEKNSRKITLPKQLNEISGLTVTADDRLFSHNDEIGTVYEVDISTGKIINKFYLGKKKLKKDFEGIAAVKDSLFLVTSSGVLYKFNYPSNERNVEYKKVKTFLSAKFNVEGLCYDKVTNSLLLACKDYAGKNLTEYKAIYAFDLSTYILNEEPRFLINLDSLKNKHKLIADWELPYENLLTRLDAAIFFCNLTENVDEKKLWQQLEKAFSGFEYRLNEEKKLSEMNYRLTFKDIKADETLSQ